MAKIKKKWMEEGKGAPVRRQLTELFWTLGPAFTRWAESHLYQQGLTPQRMRLLALLFENGPMMMSNLGDELGVTATNVTALVDALEKEGMVARKPHPTDRRATMIELTPHARSRLTGGCTEFKDRVSELFSAFSNSEQEQFLKHLQKMKQVLIERDILEESELGTKAALAKKSSA